MGLTSPQARLKTGANASNALEFNTASVLREPTSRDVGPIACSATRLCAAPCAWRELQIRLNKGDTAPVTACIFGLLGTQLSLVRYQPLPEQHLSGLGLRGVPQWIRLPISSVLGVLLVILSSFLQRKTRPQYVRMINTYSCRVNLLVHCSACSKNIVNFTCNGLGPF